MDIFDLRRFHGSARDAITLSAQGIEQVARAVEVFSARGGSAAIAALKYETPANDQEQAHNDEIDAILADLAGMGTVATKLTNLYQGADRVTMMRLRTDI